MDKEIARRKLRDGVKLMPNGCMVWGNGKATNYGVIRIGSKSYRTHRVAYELVNGPIPDGMCVCHKCDNPPCCNPEHLFLGTHQDNMNDMKAKNRPRKSHAKGKFIDFKLLNLLELFIKESD